ncbi:MAG: hypothetical protein KUG78_02760 [Kangiellaceae bacterium]|nr:hypothetical protein [Kangiellaceae bacterium]
MEVLLVVVAYIVAGYFSVKFVRSPKVKNRNSILAKLSKASLLAVFFGPSVFISVHVIFPLPAVLGLIAGISYESVRVSSAEAILIFTCSVALSSAVLYWYFTVMAKVRLNQCLNVDSVKRPASRIK